MAVKYNIKLIFYAEHGESEYGGKVINEQSKKLEILQKLSSIKLVMTTQIGKWMEYLNMI